jgi:hypothetical protein
MAVVFARLGVSNSSSSIDGRSYVDRSGSSNAADAAGDTRQENGQLLRMIAYLSTKKVSWSFRMRLLSVKNLP